MWLPYTNEDVSASISTQACDRRLCKVCAYLFWVQLGIAEMHPEGSQYIVRISAMQSLNFVCFRRM